MTAAQADPRCVIPERLLEVTAHVGEQITHRLAER
jgi:hypothetical protein